MKTCGTCNLCCKVAAIDALEKPAGQWCWHARPGQGCAIYGSHPYECRTFRCGWLQIEALDEMWKPSIAKFVLRVDDGGGRISVALDAAHPDAWLKPHYHAALKAWSRDAAVLVYLGAEATAIFPEEDLGIGTAEAGDKVRLGYRNAGLLRQPWAQVQPVSGAPREYLGRLQPKA